MADNEICGTIGVKSGIQVRLSLILRVFGILVAGNLNCDIVKNIRDDKQYFVL